MLRQGSEVAGQAAVGSSGVHCVLVTGTTFQTFHHPLPDHTHLATPTTLVFSLLHNRSRIRFHSVMATSYGIHIHTHTAKYDTECVSFASGRSLSGRGLACEL